MNVEKSIVRIHGAGEHAPKLELLDFLPRALDLRSEIVERALIVFLACQLEKLIGLMQRPVDPSKRIDDSLQQGSFLAETLGSLGVRPNVAGL